MRVATGVLLGLLCAGLFCASSASPALGPQPPIIEGDPAGAGEYPAQGALYIDDYFSGGGTLVGTRHFLTAAHCATDWSNEELPARSFRILLGDVNLAPPNSDWYGVAGGAGPPGGTLYFRKDVPPLPRPT